MKPYYREKGITIYHADCLEILPALTPVKLLLTDPPYNVSARGVGGRANTTIGRVPRKDGTTREIRRDYGDWDHGWNPDPFVSLVPSLIEASGSFIAFTSEFLIDVYLRTTLDHRGLLFWRKTNPAPSFRNQIVRAVEMAVWQTNGGGWTFNEGGYRPNIWDVPIINGYACENTTEQRWHPTQKPERLIALWLNLFSNAGDTILDPFLGSGTTLKVAKALGRTGVGIEIDERYCEISANRLAQGVLEFAQ